MNTNTASGLKECIAQFTMMSEKREAGSHDRKICLSLIRTLEWRKAQLEAEELLREKAAKNRVAAKKKEGLRVLPVPIAPIEDTPFLVTTTWVSALLGSILQPKPLSSRSDGDVDAVDGIALQPLQQPFSSCTNAHQQVATGPRKLDS